MANLINLGIIGCGYWGSLLVKKFSSLPQVKVSAVVDLQTITKHEDVLNDRSINGVVVATPVATHYKIARDCLQAGKHTFVEKPLVQTSKQAKELANIAKRKKLVLMTDFTYLYHPAVQKIKKIMDNDQLGKILFIQSLRLGLELFPKGVDVIWDLAPHDVALITYLLAKSPRKISLKTNALINKNTDDTAFINFSFSQNLAAQIMVSWLSPVKVRHFVIGGTKGTVLFDEIKQSSLLLFKTKIDKFANHKIFQPVKEAKKISFSNQEPLILVCQDFVNCIMDKKEPLSGTQISLKTVEILERIK